MTPEEAVEKYTEKYVEDYRKDLESMYKKDEQDKEDGASMEAWYSYYKGITAIFNYTSNICWFIVSSITNTPVAHTVSI